MTRAQLLHAIRAVDGALGELSDFHRSHGFYVHGVSIEAATLPRDWEHRLVPVFDLNETQNRTGWCLEPHDLAVSKLAAFRDKDRDFVRVLLSSELIQEQILRRRVQDLDAPAELVDRLVRWVDQTVDDLLNPE